MTRTISCVKAGSSPPSCDEWVTNTHKNKTCVFPFKYKDAYFNDCLVQSNVEGIWCAVEVNAALEVIEWGWCGENVKVRRKNEVCTKRKLSKSNPNYRIIKKTLAISSLEFTSKIENAINGRSKAVLPFLNKVISPLSLQNCIGILLLGTKGNSKGQISENVFPAYGRKRFRDVNEFAFSGPEHLIHESLLDLNEDLKEFNEYENSLSFANRLFIQKHAKILSSFQNNIEKCYSTKLERTDFKNDKNEDIKEFLSDDALNNATSLAIVSKGIFTGTWKNGFNVSETRKEVFRFDNGNGEFITVDMMNQVGNFSLCIAEKLDARALQMNFTGDLLSMIIILPTRDNGLAEVEKALYSFDFLKCIKETEPAETLVSIPKFQIRTKYEMKSILEDIGVSNIFKSNADFSEASHSPLHVHEMYHEAFIKITEDGTEQTMERKMKSAVTPANNFYCDHPFIFVVVENNFGSILFKGTVEKPSMSN